jgi:hypothetical protein
MYVSASEYIVLSTRREKAVVVISERQRAGNSIKYKKGEGSSNK